MAYKQLLIFSLSTCLLSCGGDVCEYNDICPVEAPSGQGGLVQGGLVEGNLTYLDCSNLDPDKVYIYGYLQERSDGLNAITDPANPTQFCVGFTGLDNGEGIITEQGTYIYSENLTFYLLNQEPLNDIGDSTERNWQYPENVIDNDIGLFSATASGCSYIGFMMMNPSNSDIYYSCDSDAINTQTSEPYYEYGDETPIAVTSDGSILFRDSPTGLILVDESLNETLIPVDEVATTTAQYLAAKLYTHPVSGSESVWLLVEQIVLGLAELSRWSLDLTTLEITDEGGYTDLPMDTTGTNQGAKLDGNGELWQIGRNGSFDMIIRRPILSSGTPTEVVYNEADDDGGSWTTQETPFVRIFSDKLVTGS
jgi:hypothetical protein